MYPWFSGLGWKISEFDLMIWSQFRKSGWLMTLQILPCDISVSGELRSKTWNKKHEGCSNDAQATAQTLFRCKETNQTKLSKANPAQPTLLSLCCYLPTIKPHRVIHFSRLSVGQWASCHTKTISQVMGHHSWCEVQLFPPPRGASENKLTDGRRKAQCIACGWLWPGCSQKVLSPSLLC